MRPPAPAPYPTASHPAAVHARRHRVADLLAAMTGIAGVTERKFPDPCGATKQLRLQSVGQPGSTIPTLGLPGAYRVVEYRGIEPQDYDPDRTCLPPGCDRHHHQDRLRMTP